MNGYSYYSSDTSLYYIRGKDDNSENIFYSNNSQQGVCELSFFRTSTKKNPIPLENLNFFKMIPMRYDQANSYFYISFYDKEYDYKSRVPFQETNFPQFPEYADCFISNQYFSQKEDSMYLGHLECILRSSSPLLIEKLNCKGFPDCKNHFKNIFEIISANNSNLKSLKQNCCDIYRNIDLRKPSSIQ